jgi:hypothetical protein
MGLIRLLMGVRNRPPVAGSPGGMLLVMMGLAGLLTKRPVRGRDEMLLGQWKERPRGPPR